MCELHERIWTWPTTRFGLPFYSITAHLLVNYIPAYIEISRRVLYDLLLYCIIDGVVIAAQCTATFSDLLCSPNLDITRT